MNNVIVLDTCAIISFFDKVFEEQSSISSKSLALIKEAFSYSDVRLIIPSIVFLELYQLYFTSEERARKIYYEVYLPLKHAENIHIRSLDQEVLTEFIKISDIEQGYKFDNHDKQILATAMVMNCSLISSDNKLKRYNNRKKFIPSILD